MLLKSSPSLTEPLFTVFQKSLPEGSLLLVWKESSIVSIFKKGSRYTPLNYRPITLTSTCCKTLERIIFMQLCHYLDDNHLLSPNQSGFQHSRTVDDQLLLIYHDVSSCLNESYAENVILFYFAQTFDTVSHVILLIKSEHFWIGSTVLNWISYFLQERVMRLMVGGSRTSVKPVISGVP